MPYDSFGNILDPTTGKRRRTPRFKQNQGYTRDGNIIQPFAFTGYREEENGLYYAQLRSYHPYTREQQLCTENSSFTIIQEETQNNLNEQGLIIILLAWKVK